MATKKQLAARLAEQTGMSQVKAAEMIDAVVSSIKETLDAGEEVILRGFGQFKAVKSAQRSGRNLRTGERVAIPSKVRIKFKAYMDEKIVDSEEN